MKELRNRRFFGAFSFVFIYCWYDVYWRSYEVGPIAAALGSLTGPAKLMVSIGVISGVIVALCLPWSQLVEQKKPLKFLFHLCAFLPYWLLPLFPSIATIALLGLLGGFCIGAVMVRSIYSMFFEIMDIHPVKVTIIGYLIIQTYIHLNDIVPLADVPLLYYGISAVTLLAGLVLSYFRIDEEEMERRRVLPENHLLLSNIWQILGMIVLLQICLSLYQTLLLSQTISRGTLGEALNIIPDVLMFIFLGVFGRKLTLLGALTAFLALYACTIGVFFIFGENGRIPMQFFMEPAYRLIDLLFVWTLITVFYTYGRSQIRLKVCLAVFFTVRFGTLLAFETLIPVTLPAATTAFIVMIPAFFAALLIPTGQRELKSMEDQRAYAERYQTVEVPLPSEREDILETRDDLLRALSQHTALTLDEQNALCYLIDGQDIDIAAYFMKVSVGHVKDLNKSVLTKLGVHSNQELLIKLGELRVDKKNIERREELFERYKLTGREREVATLLLSGMPAKNIPKSMGVSQGTVNFHSQNLYRKLSIQSRAELSSLFVELTSQPEITEQ